MGNQEIKALDCVDLDIQRGEFLSIMGAFRFGQINPFKHFGGCWISQARAVISWKKWT